jgi:dihydrofolate reductase
MHISAIFAMSENHVIGNKNKLPWHLPADLLYFKKITSGKPIIMGRKTFLSIGRPLPNRRNIIISRDKNFNAAGCDVFHSIEAATKALNDYEEVFVIGGAQLFIGFLPYIERLYLTLIHKTFSGDAYFPDLDASQWQEISRINHTADSENPYPYSFITLIKKY